MKIKKPFSKMTLNIRARLIAGFAVICVVLVAAVGITLVKVATIKHEADRIVTLRVPTASASASMINGINSSLASLRGWMITGNPSFRDQRAASWREMATVSETMDRLSATWTNPDNVAIWAEFKTVMAEFQIAQQQVEDIAHTADEQPATKVLLNNAAPLASIIIKNVTAMINEEATLAATPERKALLGMMADVRGSMGLGLANLRAFLLTGDEKFHESFSGFWATNEKRFADLSANQRFMTTTQLEAFQALSEARAAFAPLPEEMFEIRASNQWNMANFLLISEAAPRAGKLLTALAGPLQADGSRAGGMVDNQRGLLNADTEQMNNDIALLVSVEWLLLAVGLGISVVAVFVTARTIVPPIKSMIVAMEGLAGGDTDVDVPGLTKTDEIGEMAKSVQVFKENAIEKTRLEAEQVAAEKRAEEDKKAAMEQLANSFEASVMGIVENVSAASTEMRSSAESLSATAEETSKQSTAVAAASEEASTNVQTVASATEELTASVQEISRQVSQSSTVASEAVAESEQMNSEVKGLSDAAQKIGDVVSLINDIADQTNLLALNATIEAARAGEAGKGFAVVASEVKNLANQTAKATEDISTQIEEMRGATDSSVQAIDKIGERINQIAEISTAIASAVEEQSSATNEIAGNIQEASRGTQEVSSNIAGVNSAAAETGQSAGQLLEAAGELSQQSEAMRGEVDKFLAGVRAA